MVRDANQGCRGAVQVLAGCCTVSFVAGECTERGDPGLSLWYEPRMPMPHSGRPLLVVQSRMRDPEAELVPVGKAEGETDQVDRHINKKQGQPTSTSSC